MELFITSIFYLRCNTMYKRLRNDDNISNLYVNEKSDIILKEKVEKVLLNSRYIPALYCIFDIHGQLQTSVQYLLRNTARVMKFILFRQYLIEYKREILCLSDGGSIGLDWAIKSNQIENDKLNLNNSSPIVVIKHGLVGDSQSEYIIHMAWELLNAGYRVVVIISRGCGGVLLTSDSMFSGRRTSDIDTCISKIHLQYPNAKLFLLGFSLGAALSLQYIAELNQYSKLNNDNKVNFVPLTAALCISPPWNIEKNTLQPSLIGSIWNRLLVIPLKLYYLKHYQYLNSISPNKFHNISLWDVIRCSNISNFDSLFYRTYYNRKNEPYVSIEDYYQDISPIHSAHFITSIPTIALTSEDDPLCMHAHCPIQSDEIGTSLFIVRYILLLY